MKLARCHFWLVAAALLLRIGWSESTVTPLTSETAPPKGFIAGNTPEDRAKAVVDYFSTEPIPKGLPKSVAPFIAARLVRGTDVPAALAALQNTINATAKGRLDPFDLHALMTTYFLGKGKIPVELEANLKAYAARSDYTKGPGVSLNYLLMRDGGGYLAAAAWPDLVDAAGNNAAKIHTLTRQRLLKEIESGVVTNLTEYDAPIYLGTDMMAVRSLAEFAPEPEMRQKATLFLDWMFINVAAGWNRGYFTTTAGRAKYLGSSATSPNEPGLTTGYGYQFFGGLRPQRITNNSAQFWLAWSGGYHLPSIVSEIANDRATPSVSRQSVHLDSRKIDVQKYVWHSTNYSLASQREEGSALDNYLFKECRRSMLKWVSDKGNSTFFFSQQNRRRPQETNIANAFAYGENPYAQICQSHGTQLGIYNVPPGYNFQKMEVPFTKSGAIVARIERDGWVFCHAGSMLFAFRSAEPCTWGSNKKENVDVYGCDVPKNAWVLETSELDPYRGGSTNDELNRFAESILTRTSFDLSQLSEKQPKVKFRNLAGEPMELTFQTAGLPQDAVRIAGKPVHWRDFAVFDNPWMQQAIGSRQLTLTHGSSTLVYDFTKWTKTPATFSPRSITHH